MDWLETVSIIAWKNRKRADMGLLAKKFIGGMIWVMVFISMAFGGIHFSLKNAVSKKKAELVSESQANGNLSTPSQASGSASQYKVQWSSNSWTQSVPSWGASTRLSLPVAATHFVIATPSGLGSYGIHQGGHVEGLDHVWLKISTYINVASWANGTVTEITNSGFYDTDRVEWWVTVDYGGGLTGRHMEIETVYVSTGQTIVVGDSIGKGFFFSGYQSAELTLIDINRVNDQGYGQGSYVSLFDYLNDVDKAIFVDRYVSEVEPYFLLGQEYYACRPWEPYLTNKMQFHQDFEGQPVGEWILIQKGSSGAGWSPHDVDYYDVLVMMDVSNSYGTFKKFETLDDDYDSTAKKTNLIGDWSYGSSGQILLAVLGGATYYALYDVDESGDRATMTFEWQTSGFPSSFTSNAAIYKERQDCRRCDAQEFGRLP